MTVQGGLEREIQWPSIPSSWTLSFLQQVAQALAAANLNPPGGRVANKTGELAVRTLGEYTDIKGIEELLLPGGVRLKDVAVVQTLSGVRRSAGPHHRPPQHRPYIQKESDANTVFVASRVRAELNRIMRDYDGGLNYQHLLLEMSRTMWFKALRNLGEKHCCSALSWRSSFSSFS